MDNNQQTQPQPSVPATPQAVPTSPSVPLPVTPPQKEGGPQSKLIMFLLAGVVLIIIAVAGVYLFLNNKQSGQFEKSTGEASNSPLPVVKPAPPAENLDEELNAIDTATGDEDFASIDRDLEGL